MAKEVLFKLGEQECKAGITKVDRDKVYGWTEEKYTDANGALCRWATLLEDGKTIIANGGTSLKKIDSFGKEIDKATLVAIGLNGAPAQLLPSVFDGPVTLETTKTLDDYLTMDIKSVYQLSIIEGVNELLAELKKHQVLYFPFNYRADYEPDDAFMLAQDSNIFVIIGKIKNFEYVGLNVPVAPEMDAVEESEEIDFNML
ncbi:MAG: hypothetical protein JWO06_3974 [Bacteroidota bacterium]|nr:hypothetical protein [Bacteroidota bacterium]